jgi:aminodeoxyfutalosine deaminase
MPTEQTISARWVAPVSSPPIADGIVSYFDGRITYVGLSDGRRIDQRFEDAILLPGLVNAHTHLDLTGAKGLTPPQTVFCSWLESVIAYRQSRTPEQVRADVAFGVAQCLAAGTTLIGDIAVGTYYYGPLNAVAFRELIGLSESRCEAAIASWRAAGFIPAGISPHAPYSFRFAGLDALPPDAQLAMHVAETAEEMELLQTRNGPFRHFLQSIGAWEETGLAPSIAAILMKLKQRSGSTLLVHCNYLTADEMIQSGATVSSGPVVVYCPRTHAAFGHPPHPFRDFMAHGIRVVLGTDSLASNPDLSILNEARFLYSQYDSAETLITMITSEAAEALGLGHHTGRLEKGFAADLCVAGLSSKSSNPLHDLLIGDEPVQAVFSAGNRVV